MKWNLPYDEVTAYIDAQLNENKNNTFAGNTEDGEELILTELCLQWFPFLKDLIPQHNTHTSTTITHPSIARIVAGGEGSR